MKALRLAAVVSCLSLLAAGPATMPTSQPTWTENAFGRRLLRSFEQAPYPHASRDDGYKSSAGVLPKAGHYDDSTVGIFVPIGYEPGDAVDYVVHFHGHRNHVSRVFEQFPIEAQVIKSRVNAILLVPQGPKDAPDSGGGKLQNDPDGFARLIDEVTAYLKQQGVVRTDQIGRIVLCAHSGGYGVTAGILHRGGLTDHISDVLLLDASYGGLPWFADYADANAHRRIVTFHTKHLDDENAALEKLAIERKIDHRTLDESQVTGPSEAFAQRGITFVPTTLSHSGVLGERDYLAISLATSKLEKIKRTPTTRPRE